MLVDAALTHGNEDKAAARRNAAKAPPKSVQANIIPEGESGSSMADTTPKAQFTSARQRLERTKSQMSIASILNDVKEDSAEAKSLDSSNNRDPDSDSDSEAEDGSDAEETVKAGVSVETHIGADERKSQNKERKKRRQAREWEKRQQAEKAKQELKEARRKQHEKAEQRKIQRAKEVEEVIAHRIQEQKLLDEIQKLRDENQRLKEEREMAKQQNEGARNGMEIEQDPHLQNTQDNPKRVGSNYSHSEVGNKRPQRIGRSQPESKGGKRTERLASSHQSQTQVKMEPEKKDGEVTKPKAKTGWREKRPKRLEEAPATTEKSLQSGSNVDGIEHSTGDVVPLPNSHPSDPQPPTSQPPASQTLASQPSTSKLQPTPHDGLQSPKQVIAPQPLEPLVDPEEQALREAMYPIVQQRGSSLPQTPTYVEPLALPYHPESVPSKKHVWESPLPSPVEDQMHVNKGERVTQASPTNTVAQSGANNSLPRPSGEQGQEYQDLDVSVRSSGEGTDLNPESDPWVPMAQAQADSFQTPQPQSPQGHGIAGGHGALWNPDPHQVYQPPPPRMLDMTEYDGAH
ncbi:hypothetical protein K449DRAFT_207044 [Hypoxylon sp. EC38]|nr:hypothetical protein K449DRAFT_207044 [Hypoxylon sp. EC38]